MYINIYISCIKEGNLNDVCDDEVTCAAHICDAKFITQGFVNNPSECVLSIRANILLRTL